MKNDYSKLNLDHSIHLKKLFSGKPHPSLKISVIIPVKNEESNIINTLDALRLQCDKDGKELDKSIYEVLILANNCTDKTSKVVNSYQSDHKNFNLQIAEIEFSKENAHVGMARRILMDEAYERFNEINHLDGVIASTDGDSEVDKQWLYHILAEMSKGNDVVGGRIIPRDTPALSKIHHLRDVSYRYYLSRLESIIDPLEADPWPRHFQCYGPSLAVTCKIYEKAGRIPPIPFLEDEEFRKALCRIDANVRKSPFVKVYTSSRLIGKVEFGFSIQLQHWGTMTLENKQQHVESLSSSIKKMKLKNMLRQVWIRKIEDGDKSILLGIIGKDLMLDQDWLIEHFNSCKYFGELWEIVETALANGDWRLVNSLQPITEVIAEFRKYFSEFKIAS